MRAARLTSMLGVLSVAFVACNDGGNGGGSANEDAGAYANTGGTGSAIGHDAAAGETRDGAAAEAATGFGGKPADAGGGLGGLADSSYGQNAAGGARYGSGSATGGALGSGGSASGVGGASPDASDAATVDGSSDCNYPKCLFDLLSPCSQSLNPPPTCVIQDTTTSTSRQTNACYGDGTSASSTADLTTFAGTFVFKKGGAVCYTLETSTALSATGAPSSTTTTYKNGSGAVIAKVVWDVTTKATTVTCTGAQPILLNASCDQSNSVDANCQPGICNP